MPINDDPAPEHTLPHHRSYADEFVHRLLRNLKTGFLTLIALAVGGATLLLADPRARFTATMTSHVDALTPSPAPDQAAAPPAESIVEAQTASSAETEAPSDQPPAAAAPEPAAREQATPEPAAPKQADIAGDHDALFRQFQAWAAQQHEGKPDQQQNSGPENPARATADTTQSAPTQTEAASPVQGARAPIRTAQKRRVVREPATARPEAGPAPAQRANPPILHPRSGAARPPPMQETRAQETPVQNPPAPSLMQQIFGVHN